MTTTSSEIQLLTEKEVILKAVKHVGLESSVESLSGSIPQTRKFASFPLSEETLERLKEHHFSYHKRDDGILTIVDESFEPNTSSGFFETNYWNFRLEKPLIMDFWTEVRLSLKLNAVVFFAQTSSSLVSPGDRRANSHMFKVLAELFPDLAGKLPMTERLAKSDDGRVIVTFAEMHLPGLQNIIALFNQFRNGNDAVDNLAREVNVFSPAPYQPSWDRDERFVLAEDVEEVLKRWKNQLAAYRKSIRI